jgi:hypothetical protein
MIFHPRVLVFESRSILTKSLWFLDNWSEWVIDYWSFHNFQHICAFVLIKFGLNLSPHYWVHVRCSLCSSFFLCFIRFVQEFFSFYVFLHLFCFCLNFKFVKFQKILVYVSKIPKQFLFNILDYKLIQKTYSWY